MSTRAKNWADRQEFPSGYATLLVALADFHQPKLGCFPSLDRLRRRTKLSRETIKRYSKVLCQLGLISKKTSYCTGKRATVYTLHFDVVICAPFSLKAFRAWHRHQQQARQAFDQRLASATTRQERARIILSKATYASFE